MTTAEPEPHRLQQWAWGHIGLLSPWKYNIDRAARALLEPAGAELVAEYLTPLAATPQLRNRRSRRGTSPGSPGEGLLHWRDEVLWTCTDIGSSCETTPPGLAHGRGAGRSSN